MQFHAKEVGIEKEIRFFRALFRQHHVFPVQQQAVFPTKEMVEEKRDTLFDGPAGKGEDNPVAYRSHIKLRFLLGFEGMNRETEVFDGVVGSLGDFKQSGKKFFRVFPTGLHDDEHIRREGTALFLSKERRQSRRELGEEEASSKDP